MNPIAKLQIMIGINGLLVLIALILFFGAAKTTEGVGTNISVAVCLVVAAYLSYRAMRSSWGSLLVPETELRESRIATTIEYEVGDRKVKLMHDGFAGDTEDFLKKYNVTPGRRTDTA